MIIEFKSFLLMTNVMFRFDHAKLSRENTGELAGSQVVPVVPVPGARHSDAHAYAYSVPTPARNQVAAAAVESR